MIDRRRRRFRHHREVAGGDRLESAGEIGEVALIEPAQTPQHRVDRARHRGVEAGEQVREHEDADERDDLDAPLGRLQTPDPRCEQAVKPRSAPGLERRPCLSTRSNRAAVAGPAWPLLTDAWSSCENALTAVLSAASGGAS